MVGTDGQEEKKNKVGVRVLSTRESTWKTLHSGSALHVNGRLPERFCIHFHQNLQPSGAYEVTHFMLVANLKYWVQGDSRPAYHSSHRNCISSMHSCIQSLEYQVCNDFIQVILGRLFQMAVAHALP